MYKKEMRFKLPTAVRVTTAILWDVTPSSLVESWQMAAFSTKISANSTSSHVSRRLLLASLKSATLYGNLAQSNMSVNKTDE